MSWLILVEIQRYFAKGLSGPSAATIAANLSESAESVDRVMAKLQDLGLVIFIAADEGWKPAQDLGKITLSQIQFKLAQWGEHQQLIINQKTMPRSILYWETRLEELSLHQLPAITIAQVVDEETEAGDLAGNN